MRSIFLIAFGLILGAAGAAYYLWDTTAASRYSAFSGQSGSLDRVVLDLGPTSEPVALGFSQSSGAEHFSQQQLAVMDMRPCFTGVSPQAALDPDTGRPVWLKRTPLGPNGLAQRPNETLVPDLARLPGLVKLERFTEPTGTDGSGDCAASRIAEHWFLTASHCVKPTTDAELDQNYGIIIVGPRVDVALEDTPIAQVDGAVCHDDYFYSMPRTAMVADVALLYVGDPSPLEDVAVIPFERANTRVAQTAYETARFGGWGNNGAVVYGGARFLQGSDLQISSVGDTYIVADNGGAFGPCVGDSGGPLLVDQGGETIIAGVLSAVGANSKCPAWEAAYYTRTTAYETWIDQVMNTCLQDDQFVCGGTADADFYYYGTPFFR